MIHSPAAAWLPPSIQPRPAVTIYSCPKMQSVDAHSPWMQCKGSRCQRPHLHSTPAECGCCSSSKQRLIFCRTAPFEGYLLRQVTLISIKSQKMHFMQNYAAITGRKSPPTSHVFFTISDLAAFCGNITIFLYHMCQVLHVQYCSTV